MREVEMRQAPNRVEFRASEDGIGKLFGYAAVFNRLSQNLGGFVERVDPAAFNKTLADGGNVFARFNHDSSLLLGTTDSGTVRLSVDGTGLAYEVDLPDTGAGRDVAALAKRGDLQKSSFAFRTMADDWGWTPDDFPMRTLLDVQLVDVAPVTDPAYRDTTTGLRSLATKFDLDFTEVRSAASADGLRALLTKDSLTRSDGKADKDEPGATHSLLALRRRQLDFLSRP